MILSENLAAMIRTHPRNPEAMSMALRSLKQEDEVRVPVRFLKIGIS
jgi:hypothetical protein